MRKNFKMIIRKGRVHILRYEVGLFGPGWGCMVSFTEDCTDDCKRIVALLNKCDNITQKENDNDRERDS